MWYEFVRMLSYDEQCNDFLFLYSSAFGLLLPPKLLFFLMILTKIHCGHTAELVFSIHIEASFLLVWKFHFLYDEYIA